MYDNETYLKLEKELAKKFQFEGFRSGFHTIRNEKGWRDNEVDVEYVWFILFDRTFVGKGGILNIKYSKTQFREVINDEKLVKAIFSFTPNGALEAFYQEEEEQKPFTTLIQEFNDLSLFDLNEGITLDGIGYRVQLYSKNTDVTMILNTPNDSSWRKLEDKFWTMGEAMAKNSNDDKLEKLFHT